MTPSQWLVFLENQGDAWYQRNRQLDADQAACWLDYALVAELLAILRLICESKWSVFEVECARIVFLARLSQCKVWSLPAAKSLPMHSTWRNVERGRS